MSKTKKWLIEEERAEEMADEVMERILKRDGRKAYQDASGDFLTGFCNTIVAMDGGPERLLGRLRRLERMYGARQRVCRHSADTGDSERAATSS